LLQDHNNTQKQILQYAKRKQLQKDLTNKRKLFIIDFAMLHNAMLKTTGKGGYGYEQE
jgi:hypothetical protein